LAHARLRLRSKTSCLLNSRLSPSRFLPNTRKTTGRALRPVPAWLRTGFGGTPDGGDMPC
jgi:hypothetical protein